jgi:hypothetical protein
MRARALLPLAAAAALAVAAPTATAEPTQSQKTFTDLLLKDPKTSAGVKRLLRTKAGIVDPRSGFVDVTGDQRQDAMVLVTTGGAAGTVALYIFSTHGQAADDQQTSLKVLFRLQVLYRATLRLNGTTVSVTEPLYQRGDDLCCPKQIRTRDYGFDPARTAFVRTDDRTLDAP